MIHAPVTGPQSTKMTASRRLPVRADEFRFARRPLKPYRAAWSATVIKDKLLRFVPAAAHIRRLLDEREEHRAPNTRFETELEDHLTRHGCFEIRQFRHDSTSIPIALDLSQSAILGSRLTLLRTPTMGIRHAVQAGHVPLCGPREDSARRGPACRRRTRDLGTAVQGRAHPEEMGRAHCLQRRRDDRQGIRAQGRGRKSGRADDAPGRREDRRCGRRRHEHGHDPGLCDFRRWLAQRHSRCERDRSEARARPRHEGGGRGAQGAVASGRNPQGKGAGGDDLGPQ